MVDGPLHATRGLTVTLPAPDDQCGLSTDKLHVKVAVFARRLSALRPKTHTHRAVPSPSHPRTLPHTARRNTAPSRAPFPRWGPKRTHRAAPTVQSRPQHSTTPHVEAPNAHLGTPQVCEVGPNSDLGMKEEGLQDGVREEGRQAKRRRKDARHQQGRSKPGRKRSRP